MVWTKKNSLNQKKRFEPKKKVWTKKMVQTKGNGSNQKSRSFNYLRNIGHGLFFFHTFQREQLFWAQFLSICLKNMLILSAMKMRRTPPSSVLLMRSQLPYWDNISLLVQNDECASYRHPTDLEIWEDSLGVIAERTSIFQAKQSRIELRIAVLIEKHQK